MAERLRRKTDQIDPTQVCRPYCRPGEAHLRQILTRYAAYYNELRTHRSRGKDAPISRAIQHVGRIISGPSLADFITIIAEFILPNLVFGTDNGAKRPPHEGTRQVSHSQIDHLSELADVRVLLLQQLNNARRVAVVQDHSGLLDRRL